MQTTDFDEIVAMISKEDPRYKKGAYVFIQHALDFTLKKGAKESPQKPKHVRGPELLEGIKEYAQEQFGLLAMTVLQEWGIERCEDFGNIVFNLVDFGLLGKTEQDCPSDFAGGYDFEEAFVAPYLSQRRLRRWQKKRTQVDSPS